MSNREKWFWLGGAFILVLLFLMSSTDLIIKEKKAEVYPVSVIIRHAGDDYYANFKKGVDKAAEDFNADVNFITLYTDNSGDEQLELVQREIRDGTRAIVLEPVLPGKTVMALDELRPGCPVVLLNASSPENYVAAAVNTDSYEMGRKLGGAAAGRYSGSETVFLFTQELELVKNTEMYDGVCSVLEGRNCPYRVIEKKSPDTYRQAIESTVYPGEEQVIAVALDEPSLYEVSQILKNSSVYRAHVTGVYGPGDAEKILTELDNGVIDGIVTVNRFNEGYLSVQAAVEAIKGSLSRKEYQLGSFYLERDNLRDKAYEKMLYPIE